MSTRASSHATMKALSAYLDEKLAQSDQGRLEAHLETCDECRERFTGMRGIITVLQQSEGTPLIHRSVVGGASRAGRVAATWWRLALVGIAGAALGAALSSMILPSSGELGLRDFIPIGTVLLVTLLWLFFWKQERVRARSYDLQLSRWLQDRSRFRRRRVPTEDQPAAGERLPGDLGAVYDELDTLYAEARETDGNDAPVQARIDEALQRLRGLQTREARRIRRSLEGSLSMPIRRGAELRDQLWKLRQEYGDTATPDPAA